MILGGKIMNELYNMIYKRKSIRKFDSSLSVSDEELELIKSQFEKVIPLILEIKIKFEIVKKSETTAKYVNMLCFFIARIRIIIYRSISATVTIIKLCRL